MLVLRMLVLLLLMLLLMPVRFRTAPRTVTAPSVFLTSPFYENNIWGTFAEGP